jgi:hypothetical protein
MTIEAEDPLTGDMLDVGTTVLADDVCETCLTDDAEHMLQTETKSSEMLVEEFEKAELVQNVHNAENVPTFKNKAQKPKRKERNANVDEIMQRQNTRHCQELCEVSWKLCGDRRKMYNDCAAQNSSG